MRTERKIPGKPEQIVQRYAALRFESLADIPMRVAAGGDLAQVRPDLRNQNSALLDVNRNMGGTRWN